MHDGNHDDGNEQYNLDGASDDEEIYGIEDD